MTRSLLILALALPLACAAPELPESDAPVGPRAEGGHVLPTRQVVEPAGKTLAFDGRPLDLVLAPDGRFVFVKEKTSVLTIDARNDTIASRYTPEKLGASMHGIAITRAGDKLYFTGTEDQLVELAVAADGSLRASRTLVLPQAEVGGDPYPCGLALSADESTAFVCLSRGNALALVDLRAGKLTATIPVGIAPYDVVLAPDGRCAYVSNFGGRRATAGDRTSTSSGTPLVIDERGIGASGTISVVDLEARASVAEIACGLHPSDLELARDGARLYVAAANSDAVFVIDTRERRILREICVKPDPSLPFGSIANALALAPDESTLYVANGGNNAVAVVRLAGSGRVAGFIPTGAFPGAIALCGERLFVANVKGEGSRATKEGQKGWHSPNERGSVSCIPGFDPATLAQWTERALRDARVPQALRSAAARAGTGMPSAIEHVVYVLKENRTYDQVFGDLAQANGDPSLCVFGREVTPNQHALAESFVLLDNYYCNGVVSADGHQWAMQGLVVDYLEKQFGGWTRSYDLGTDALTYAANGFLWDAVLLHGLSFRNYGEMDFARIDEPKGTWFDVQQAVREGRFRSSRDISPDTLAALLGARLPRLEHEDLGPAAHRPLPGRVPRHGAERRVPELRDRLPAAGPHLGPGRELAHAARARRGQRPRGRAPDRGALEEPLLGHDRRLRQRGRSAERLGPRRRTPFDLPRCEPLGEARRRAAPLLQPELGAAHDGAYPGPAAALAAGRGCAADGRVLHRPAGPRALHGAPESHRAR